MLDDVRALLILQDRDRRILDLTSDLERLPQDEARAKTKLADDQAAVKAAHDAILAAELELKRLELDAETRKTTILRLKTQQFETRKNDEYQALGHEVTRYEAEIDALETRELEIMEKLDGLRETERAAKEALAKTSKLVDEDLAAIKQRHERETADLGELKTERATLAAGISDEILPLYDRLMKTKNGLAVAPIDGGKCGGCHIKLIASTVVNAQKGTVLTRCEDCGRILYQPE